MGHPKLKTTSRYATTLTAIAGGKHDGELTPLTQIAWVFASSCLWNYTQFSSKQKQAAKEKITGYLQHAKTPRRGFLSFCQRILIARGFYPKGAGFPPLPSLWLDPGNPQGFVATRLPFIKLKALQESLPLYKYEWKALAEAVLDFGEEPTASNFNYWKSYFTEKQTPALLQLFQVFVSNFHFSI